MITFPMIPGAEFSLYLLVFLSITAGTISGFVGVGGGFIMTPALIIMGFPAPLAVGTGVLWVMGNAIIGTLQHRKLGNVDGKLGLFMIVFMMIGMEIGIRALNAATRNGMAEIAVLCVTVFALLFVGGSIFLESSRTTRKSRNKNDTKTRTLVDYISQIKLPPVIYFPRSNIRVSLWIMMLVGLAAGTLAGFIGVGGGFIIVPSLVYIFGVPSFISVGTSLFQIIFPAAFGAARYTLDGNVVIFASLIMILGSSIGIYFGAQLTRFLEDISMKYVLGSTILVAVLGSCLKIVTVIMETEPAWLQEMMIITTYGGLAVIFLMITGLFITAIRHRKGKHVPAFIQLFIKN